MASLEQIEANRLNALKSTGPRTPEGKARSALNAIKHGLRSDRAVIPGEDPEEYEAFACWFLDSTSPDDPLEVCLLRQMITAEWRLRRIERLENGSLIRSLRRSLQSHPPPDDPIQLTRLFNELLGCAHCGNTTDIFTRYTRTYTQMYHRAFKALLALRNLRAATEAQPRPTTTKSGQTNPIPPNSPRINKLPASRASSPRPPNLPALPNTGKEVA